MRLTQKIIHNRSLLIKNNPLLFIVFFIALCYSCVLQAQTLNYSTINEYNFLFKKAIGLDQNLINGYQYINHYPKAKGHAYFGNNEFLPGRIIVNGKEYNNVYLKYDIYNQHILLKYKNSYGGSNHLILHNHSIEEFEIDDKIFKKLQFPNTQTQFYQIIAENKITCLYSWAKKINTVSGTLESYYEYSDQSKKSYLVINGQLHNYKGNRSFLKLFSGNQKIKIKQYLNNRKIKLKKASDKTMKTLIDFCANLEIEAK